MRYTSTTLKLSVLALAGTLSLHLSAKEIPFQKAGLTAENFFESKISDQVVPELSYTGYDKNGKATFYAFNFKGAKGFVIVSADDVANPIIGYSTDEVFVKPVAKSNIEYFLNKKSKEVEYLRENNISDNAKIKTSWEKYSHEVNQSNRTNVVPGTYLLDSRWNQSPFYNADCPGGSVTGCVATAMAQIMKFWNYPATGNGQSSYCCCTASGYQNDYGTLSANYGTSTYNWANMPNTLTGPNADVAKLNYHCGVSVEMNYDPAGSSAWVIVSDNPVSAQGSYVNFFKYDPTTIEGLYRGNYQDAVWYAKMKADIDIGRPMQYVGFGNSGGHTWVCDGYDNLDFFHMNWGWGGASNGFFAIDALNPSGMDFSQGEQCVFGILPIVSASVDAAAVSVSSINEAICTDNLYAPVFKLRNFGSANLTSCNVNYKLDNGAVQVYNWSGNMVTGQASNISLANYTLTAGTHTMTVFTSNPNNGSDGNNANNQVVYIFNVYNSGVIPMVEGFEVPNITADQWKIIPSQNGASWAVNSQASSGGSRSIMIDNSTNVAGNTSILMGMENYDFYQVQNPSIAFKVAYQRKNANNNDKLSLEVSTDCGKSWTTRWSKQGSELASVAALSNAPFVPTAAQFTPYMINAWINSSSLFRWVFEADPTSVGNNIYLDDINLADEAVGIKEIGSFSSAAGFELFPNPSNGAATVRFNLTKNATVNINVTDLMGRNVLMVADKELSQGVQEMSFNKNAELAKGIYLIGITVDGVTTTRKLVIN
jgi:hypothetical protein